MLSQIGKLLGVILLVSVVACSQQEPLLVVGGPSMGTTWSVKAVANNGQSSEVLQAALQQELDTIEALMSTWRDDSEVSQFNRAVAGCYPVSTATIHVIESSLKVSEQTAGAFDITVAPLIRLWGFGKRFTGDAVPSDTDVSERLNHTGYQQLSINGGQLCKGSDKLEINLSAIAKGFAVDRLASQLQQLAYEHYLVEVGGELYAKGRSPADRPWTIGVEQPISDGRAIMESIAVPIANQGVATSGDYRNYFEKKGKRYSHILNPVTGKPVAHQLASVTVLAKTSMQADAWATALLVMGVEKGYKPLMHKAWRY